MSQSVPDFNTANRRLPLCADSRLPLLIKLERERKEKKKNEEIKMNTIILMFPSRKAPDC